MAAVQRLADLLAAWRGACLEISPGHGTVVAAALDRMLFTYRNAESLDTDEILQRVDEVLATSPVPADELPALRRQLAGLTVQINPVDEDDLALAVTGDMFDSEVWGSAEALAAGLLDMAGAGPPDASEVDAAATSPPAWSPRTRGRAAAAAQPGWQPRGHASPATSPAFRSYSIRDGMRKIQLVEAEVRRVRSEAASHAVAAAAACFRTKRSASR